MKVFNLINQDVKDSATNFIRGLPDNPVYRVEIKEAGSIRSAEQNIHMWRVLTDLQNQVEWHGIKLTKDEWKDVITAGLKKQKVVPGIDGGFVVIGARTSKMSIKQMIDVIDFAYAFGSERNVKWTPPKYLVEGVYYGKEAA